MKKLSIVIICLLQFCISVQGQTYDERKLSFLLDKDVRSFTLDCKIQDYNMFLWNTPLFKNIETIIIYNCPEDFNYAALQNLKRIRSISIRNSEYLDIDELISTLSELKHLRKLEISSSYIGKFPKKLSKLKRVKYLRLFDCDVELNNRFIKICDKMQRLDSLDIQGQNLCLYDLRFEKLENITYLAIDGNFDLNNEYTIPSLEVKHLVLYGDLGFRSSNNLPDNVDFISYNPLFVHEYNNNKLPKENLTLEWNTIGNNFYKDSYFWFKGIIPYAEYQLDSIEDQYLEASNQESLNVYTGKFKLRKSDLQIHSDGYLKYDQFIEAHSRYLLEWDTTSYKNRYFNLNYSHEEILPFQWSGTKRKSGLRSRKDIKQLHNTYQRLIRFDKERAYGNVYHYSFKKQARSFLGLVKTNQPIKNIQENFPEMNPILKRDWLMDSKDAKVLMRGNFYDMRLIFDSINDQLYLELKSLNGFDRLPIHLVDHNSDTIRTSNLLIYKRYKKGLDRRLAMMQKRSDRHLSRITRVKSDDSWEAFKKNLSKRENEMTEAQWLYYRAKVMKQETKALLNTSITLPYLERYLSIQGYEFIDLYEWRKRQADITMVRDSFYDETGKGRSLKAIHVLDVEKKTVVSFNAFIRYGIGNTGYNSGYAYYLPSYKLINQRVILELSDGSFAIGSLPENKITLLNVEVLPQGISDLRMLIKKIDPEIL